jgi:hypothetical protein
VFRGEQPLAHCIGLSEDTTYDVRVCSVDMFGQGTWTTASFDTVTGLFSNISPEKNNNIKKQNDFIVNPFVIIIYMHSSQELANKQAKSNMDSTNQRATASRVCCSCKVTSKWELV